METLILGIDRDDYAPAAVTSLRCAVTSASIVARVIGTEPAPLTRSTR